VRADPRKALPDRFEAVEFPRSFVPQLGAQEWAQAAPGGLNNT
jgi:hypothetical protein